MAEVVVVADKDAAGELAAESIQALIAAKPDAVLGLATGSTPLPVYRALARRVAEAGTDVSHVRGYALDEYVGLPAGHPESYRSVITREVVEPLGLTPALIHVPNGAFATIEHAGADYEKAIAESGGVDVQLLGIGTDGHIGFNEPGLVVRVGHAREDADRADPHGQRPLLRQRGRRAHALHHAGPLDHPAGAHLLLLAFGEGKAEALAGAVEGPVSASNPGSAIQLHPHVTVLVDEAAASRLRNIDYYRYAYEHKPAWQKL
jgi:6-phosphogluconolactonase/Glucosamine-6-phosphate isomerase/deaminase